MSKITSRTFKAASVAVLFAGAFALQRAAHSSEEAVRIPRPRTMKPRAPCIRKPPYSQAAASGACKACFNTCAA